MKRLSTTAAIALCLSLTGCSATGYAPVPETQQVAPQTQQQPVETYEEHWAKLKSNISVDINCDNYAYTAQTVADVTNNNNEDVTVSITIAYLHKDGSIAAEVDAMYEDILANTTQKVYFSNPSVDLFAYTTCKVIKISDESFGND